MADDQISRARELIKSKPYLMWSTTNYSGLSPESILESVFSYGDWSDVTKLIDIFGIEQSAQIFNSIKNRRRVNLRPQTVNFFSKYFEKYAQGNTFGKSN